VQWIDKRFDKRNRQLEKLALRWRANGNEPTNTSITLMAAHPDYIGKSVEVGSGSSPLCGVESRRPKGYAGSSPVPSATQDRGRWKSFCNLNQFFAAPAT